MADSVTVEPATPMGTVPKAVTDKRLTIPAQPHPGAQPVTVAQPTGDPAPTPTTDTPAEPADATFDDPAIAAFLVEPAPAVPPVQAVAQPATPESPAPAANPQPAPGPALSFDSMFASAPEAPPQTGDAAELVALRDQIASMQTALESRPTAPTPPAAHYDITDEERETYGDSVKLIERIASAHASAILTQVDTRLTALEDQFTQSIEQVQTGVQDMRSSSYSQQLELQVPDLNTLTNNPAFLAYTHQQIPYSGGVTVGQRIKEAHSRGELSTVVAFMNEFRGSLAGGTNDPAVPSMDNLTLPATSAAPVAAAPAQQVQREPLRWSVRQNAARELRAGRLTQERFDRIDQAYRNADSQGLVDYSS